MLIGWCCVWTAATSGPIVHPKGHTVYEHDEPWWNDLDRGELVIRQPDLSGNPTSSHLVSSRRNGRSEWWIWFWEVFLFISTSFFFFTFRKILRHGTSGFTLPPKECVLRIFIALTRQGLNLRTYHYTTEEIFNTFSQWLAKLWPKSLVHSFSLRKISTCLFINTNSDFIF
jgi:hypothetical protein